MKRIFLTLVMSVCICGAVQAIVRNPMIWADVPDPDVIRVGEYYYMVTTTMHLMPGAPIMRSKDFSNWETVGYLFDRLTDSPKYDMEGGTAYGRGQWATSLRYHKGTFYALFAPNDNIGGDSYIMTAKDAAGPWKIHARLRHFHDASLFFDDDDRVYVIHGTGEMCELTPDLQGVVPGSDCQLFQREADETGLLEGSRFVKHDGKYYLLMISHVWAPGRYRRQVCYRADDIHGPYEKKVILQSGFGGFSHVGQGTIVDGNDGKWYGVIFQDRGGVGRVLTYMPCTWVDGWPILGDELGCVPATMPQGGDEVKSTRLVVSDDFSDDKLNLLWQWNHNPVDEAWSLTERPGFLRLKTNKVVTNLYEARNTISQRMEGPRCTASVRLDLRRMRDGDRCGFAAFNGHSGVLTVERKGKEYALVQSNTVVNLTDREKAVSSVDEEIVERIVLKRPKQIELRIDADFNPGKDIATFYYRVGKGEWQSIGKPYKMQFDYRRLFMGTRYAIFNYATKQAGGYVDIDRFDYSREELAWTPGLKDAYREYFPIGVSVNQRNVRDSLQIALLTHEFATITAENDMKPGPTEPHEGQFNWRGADRIANFARINGLKMRGHCLMWHNQIGEWMVGDNPTKEEFFRRMRNHIHAVVNRYKDVVYCWDVVNEAITDNPHAENPYRQSQLYKIAGEEFIAKAFEYAHEADPDALLFYNDYNECDPVKSRRIYEMVKRMKEAGVPIHGIGMQGHYNIYGPSEQAIDNAITLYKQVVDHIHMTELDIRANEEMGGQLLFDQEGMQVNDTLNQYLADQYARVFRVLRKHKDVVKNVTFWNLSDRDSWLGARNYPLLFDVEYKPKKAYEYVMEMRDPEWDMPRRPRKRK